MIGVGSIGIQYVARHTEASIRTALDDTRIVAIVGPRQSGKTTLARRIANERNLSFLTLDDSVLLQFAREDPVGFLRGDQKVVIDDIQRAPDLILALKKVVDEDTRPGRFLITGSADLFRAAISPDSLAGRVELFNLLPFSQAEIEGHRASRFLDRAFAADFSSLPVLQPDEGVIQRVLRGGFPEAIRRETPARRTRWLLAYAEALAGRDAPEIALIRKSSRMHRLVEHAAAEATNLVNLTRLGANLGVDSKTADRWVSLLEHLFLLRRVPAWHRSGLKRLVRAPKLHFLDSGLLAAVQRADARALERERQRLGPLLECFVFGEILKQADLDEHSTTIFHYRDKDQVEVDLVLERHGGSVVGIDVKASATVNPRDFRGLHRLRVAAGSAFACGILLHDGDRIQQMSSGLFLMPIQMLWEA